MVSTRGSVARKAPTVPKPAGVVKAAKPHDDDAVEAVIKNQHELNEALEVSFSDVFARLDDVEGHLQSQTDDVAGWFEGVELQIEDMEAKLVQRMDRYFSLIANMLQTITDNTNPLARQADIDRALLPVFGAINNVKNIVLSPPTA